MHEALPQHPARLSHDGLRGVYRQMRRIRLVEEAIAGRYGEQEMRCPVHLSIGQEASAVGACRALQADDKIVSTHRCHGHYLAKGGDLGAMLAELYGKVTGCCGGRGGSMHLFDDAAGVLASVPIVASSIPIGVGVALAFRQRAQRRVCMAFLGDAALEEGVAHEAANFATAHRLPIVFFVENNLYSVYTRIDDRQPSGQLTRFGAAHGLPARRADGNDVLEVYRRSTEAVERARSGGGPGLVCVDTYRWLEHCGPQCDDQLGYRPQGELARWKAQCPIQRFKAWLERRELWDAALECELLLKLKREIETAFTAAQRAPFPNPAHARTKVYA
ncbi:MAG: thiamine pyrophosphate-dependent dehydrogenase E1 component subunit alpha [Proteobacteria bacterium]|nr:thiamine pyrophosphate-dependent dehydrogenase E1 component subunit alpha [Pseudomonadota bacterium]